MEVVKRITNNHTKLCLIVLFILGIIIYGIVAKTMTNPIFLTNDEELYVNMARSFFFEHNFSRGYEIIDYTCVLYSIIISIAYIFYSPENIIFIMRMIGIIAVLSSIFPTYLLSKKILGSKTKSIGVSAIMLIIPEMISGLYLIQENFSYPIFLWISYLVYTKLSSKKEKNIGIDIAIILLLEIIFFIKSYTIIFAFGYFLFLFVEAIREKKYKKIKVIVLQVIFFVCLILLGILAVNAINGFQEGVNHYTTQIFSIFPINLNKIRIFNIWYILLSTILFILCRSFTNNDTNNTNKVL